MKLACILLSTAATAMAADPLQLSLKRAVEIATSPEGSAKIQLATEAEKQAESRQAQARAALLPNVDGALSARSVTQNLNTIGLRLISPIPGFQLPTFVGPFTVLDGRLTGTQTIFDFSSIRRYQASKLGTAATRSDIEATEEQVASAVARAYLAAVRADADVITAQANVKLSEEVLQQAEDQKAAGTGTGIEITRAKVQLANDRQRLVAARVARRTAILQLLRAMNMRLDADVDLTDTLKYEPMDPMTLEQARKKAFQERADYWAQQQREDNARLSASATRLERVPSFSAFGNYGSIGDAFDNLLPTRTYGVQINVPIFDGGRRDARRRESASLYRSEKVRTNDLKEQIELDVRVALESLRSAEEEVQVAKEGLVLAENEVAQALRRNRAGVAPGLEVTDAQTRLARARNNQTAALYNYNIARLDLAQATGTVRSIIYR